MKVPLTWLRDYLDTEASLDAITDTLTRIGLEVDAVEDPGAGLRDFRIAAVLAADNAPGNVSR